MSEIRRKLMVSQDSLLPKEYKQVQYLESTGTQYINTDLGYNEATTKVIIECAMYSFTYNKYAGFFGAFDGYNGHRYCFALGYESGKMVGQFYTWEKSSMNAPTDRTMFTLENNKVLCNTTNTYIVDQSSHVLNYKFNTKMGLFMKYSADTNKYDNPGTYRMRIWSFEKYESGVLESIMIPCYRKSDTKPGMYDIVRNRFFVNLSGGTDFNIGY